MRAEAGKKHFSLGGELAKESNFLTKRFKSRLYSKIDDIDSVLSKRDISVEKKKSILLRKLHESVARAFSIDKKKFRKKDFESLKSQLSNIRRIVLKLRSINYYLETSFLRELKSAKVKINIAVPHSMQQNNLARDELELLELTAYKLIEEVLVLDKRLLGEYSGKEDKIMKAEKSESKGLVSMLKKESELLEHLEAKIPPPRAATISLVKEPVFTHWVARVFALLSYIEHLYRRETIVFTQLKKNKSVKNRISKKISHLLEEKSKLLKIMEEKAASMRNKVNGDLREELRNFTTIIGL